MTVVLTPLEFSIGCWVGDRRRITSLYQKNQEAYGADRKSIAEQHYFNIVGACGEMAVAKATGRYWPMTVNQKRNEPDVFPDIQVRALARDNYDLIVRDTDEDHYRFVLALGDPPEFRIAGWCWGYEARKDEWRKDRGGRNKPCFWVPQSSLHDPLELVLT